MRPPPPSPPHLRKQQIPLFQDPTRRPPDRDQKFFLCRISNPLFCVNWSSFDGIIAAADATDAPVPILMGRLCVGVSLCVIRNPNVSETHQLFVLCEKRVIGAGVSFIKKREIDQDTTSSKRANKERDREEEIE